MVSENLPTTKVDLLRKLAAQGVDAQTLRKVADMTPAAWRKATAEDEPGVLSPISTAIAEGRATMVDDCMKVMYGAAMEGDTVAARYIIERFSPKDHVPAGKGTNVMIVLNAPMSEEDYRRVHATVVEEE